MRASVEAIFNAIGQNNGRKRGAILPVAGASILLGKKTRTAATYLGTWIVLLVVFIYGAILIASLANPSTGVNIEGINYFLDTLPFSGAILALANTMPRTDYGGLMRKDCAATRFG